jgi:hypothetical protein
MKNIIQKLKEVSFYNFLLFLIVLANAVAAYGAFRTGDTGKGLDKLTIAILFADMYLYLRNQKQSRELIENYQSLSDLKTQIINDQEKEIEALQQENAKLQKANEKFKGGLFIK